MNSTGTGGFRWKERREVVIDLVGVDKSSACLTVLEIITPIGASK